VPVSGLRCPLCPTGMRSWGVAVGPAAARLGWPGSAWSPAVSTTARRLPEVGGWPSRLAQVVLGQRRVGFDLVVVVGRGWAVGQVDRVADRGEAGCGRGSPVGRQLAVTTLRGHGAARTESPHVSESPPGWTVT
jgi:hypothetical protein